MPYELKRTKTDVWVDSQRGFELVCRDCAKGQIGDPVVFEVYGDLLKKHPLTIGPVFGEVQNLASELGLPEVEHNDSTTKCLTFRWKIGDRDPAELLLRLALMLDSPDFAWRLLQWMAAMATQLATLARRDHGEEPATAGSRS